MTTPDVYDEVAPTYAAYRRWWLAVAGAGAERRLRRTLRRALRPGIRVLDAGAGTGALAHAVLAAEPAAQVTLLDRSAGMLAEAGRSVGAPLVRGDVATLPFAAGTFHLVTAGWVLETLADPASAVRELLRVLAPDGRVLTVFSAEPRIRVLAAAWRPLERVIQSGFAGRFLRPGEVPFHACHASERHRPVFAPTATVFLGRCCLEAIAATAVGSEPQRLLEATRDQ